MHVEHIETLPKKLIFAGSGNCFDAYYDENDQALIFRKLPVKANWLKVLKSCPVPMDDIPPRSREMPKRINL